MNLPSPASHRGSRRGSALLLVLWAIAVLSFTVIAVVEFARTDFDELSMQAQEFRAHQLAESGIAIGLHPTVEKTDSVLKQQFSGGESFEVRKTNEGARLNINYLLARNQTELLRLVFSRWGLETEEIEMLTDALLDWTDANDTTRLNGAEYEFYEKQGHPEFPSNRAFQSLDEMAAVRGMDVVAELKPNWKEFFTVFGDGKLDVNEASAELIATVCNVTQRQAEFLTQQRLGLDGEPDTLDDVRYTDLEQVRQILTVNPAQFDQVKANLTLQGAALRVESTGRVGNYERKLAVVALRNTNPPRIVAWLEP